MSEETTKKKEAETTKKKISEMSKAEIRKKLAAQKREADALERGYVKAELSEKLACITDVIEKDKSLCKQICDLPRDEVRIVMNEVINSPEFHELFGCVLTTSSRLSELRRKKELKAMNKAAQAFEKAEITAISEVESTTSVTE